MSDKEIHVLILDDEKDVLNAFKKLFVDFPCDIAVTSDFEEAMAIIEKENIKVVVSDYQMPKISGIEFLSKVRDVNSDIVRMLLTGHIEFSTAQEAINVGEVFRFISKPWNDGDLRLAVEQAIKQYDLVEENKNLFEAQREFTSTVSHELRTPLASIKSTVDLVLSETSGPLNEDQKNFLQKTKKNVDRLNRFINDILDLTKMEAGKTEFNIDYNDMGQIIEEVVEVQMPVAKGKGLFIKGVIPPELPKVLFDVDKMYQVFDNLVNNAIKFTDNGGITISCIHYDREKYIEVCIEDTGSGIKKEYLDKLFKKFQQIGDPIKQVGGTGLGLSICKEIIARHGGKIWVESEFGQGSLFRFIIPAKERKSIEAEG